MREKNPKAIEKWLLTEHNKDFITWFREQISKDNSASETLKWLAFGLQDHVICRGAYDINNYSFFTKSQDDKSTTQNSGVTLDAESMHFSTSKDKNPIMGCMPYYGYIEEIWEVDYTKFIVPIFKCKWVNNNTSMQTEESGMMLADLQKLAYKDEPFIMAYQTKQVFYVKYPSNERWSVVFLGKSSHEDQGSTLDIPKTNLFS